MADLNALIAQGAQFKAPPDPFAQYAKMQQLEQGQTTNQLNRMKMDEYQRDFQQKNKLYTSLQNPDFKLDSRSAIGYGKPGMDAFKLQQDSEKDQALTLKAKNEALKFSLDNSRSFLVGVNDQPAYDAWRAYSVKNVPELEKMLPSTFSIATKEGLLKKADDISKRLTAPPPAMSPLAMLQAEKAALPPGDPRHLTYDAAIAKESQFAPRPITQVNLPGNESKYSETVGAGSGKKDLAAFERSEAIPNDFEKIDETLNTLRNTDINTGLGADLFTILDRVRAQVTADKKAGKRAVNTEYLDSLLGSAVFPQIQALGIGARGMDTPAERDFLRKVMTGSINLNKDTLIKMTELRRKGLENEAKQINNKVKKGVFKPFEKDSRREFPEIIIPELLKSGETNISADAIADLKAGRGSLEQFDAIFGKGSANRVLGKGN